MKDQKQNNNGVYLGVKSTIPVIFEDYNKTSRNNNVLVLGRTGGGMSRMDIYYNAKQYELEELEKVFKENGYTKEMIEEIKHIDGVTEIEDFIDNLEEEQSNWGK